MDTLSLIERGLADALKASQPPSAPPLLADAMTYAVFPGGARLRPRLCVAVAEAYGTRPSAACLAAATSLELLHCASLVHDDLPCFDNADTRRGKPSLHIAYGEPLAVLTGDALILLAMEVLAKAAISSPTKVSKIMLAVCQAVGMPRGIIAGQAWESEPTPDVHVYHRCKTASLFVAACSAGALSAGRDPAAWRSVGEMIGEAYQALDDLRDMTATASELGKPANQDARLGRPNLLNTTSLQQAAAVARGLIERAIECIPRDADPTTLDKLISGVARHLDAVRDLEAA